MKIGKPNKIQAEIFVNGKHCMSNTIYPYADSTGIFFLPWIVRAVCFFFNR